MREALFLILNYEQRYNSAKYIKLSEERGDKIPHYINDPIINRLTAPENKLHRPDINFVKAALFGAALILVLYILTHILCGLLKLNSSHTVIYLFSQVLVLFFSMKYILIWLVRVYQRYAKSEMRLRCRFTPSCSEYSILAIQKYGAFRGTIKTVKRLRRCRYPNGGIDYP